MINKGTKEIFKFGVKDINKSHFTKSDLEKIIRVYNICQISRDGGQFKTLCNNRFVMIVEEAEKQIRKFAEGKITLTSDAIDLMNDFISMFGRDYYHHGKEMMYEYTPEAIRAKTVLKNAKYQYYSAQRNKTAASSVRHSVKVQQTPQAAVQRQALNSLSAQETQRANDRPGIRATKSSGKKVFVKAGLFQKRSLKSSFLGKIKNSVRAMGEDFSRSVRRYGMVALALWGMGGSTGVAGAGTRKAEISKFEASGILNNQFYNDDNQTQQNATTKTVSSADFGPGRLTAAEMRPSLKRYLETDWANVKIKRIETIAAAPVSSDTLKHEAAGISPYKGEYTNLVIKNNIDYKDFVTDLVAQFRENISKLKDVNVNKNKFYSEQESLIAKYGKSKHITRSKSCESMSYATFLSTYEKNNSENNFIAQACKELLLQVSNPHACVSNKSTFEANSSTNLRRTLTEKLKGNKYGIYMMWTFNGKGGLHRQTVIGTGDGHAYLLAFNNNRIVKMKADNLDKIAAGRGFLADLGTKICNEANVMAVLNHEQNKLNDNNEPFYYALAMNSQNRGI